MYALAASSPAYHPASTMVLRVHVASTIGDGNRAGRVEINTGRRAGRRCRSSRCGMAQGRRSSPEHLARGQCLAGRGARGGTRSEGTQRDVHEGERSPLASSETPDHRRHALPIGIKRVHPHDGARVGGVDHLVVTDIDPDVVEVTRVGTEGKGDDITRLNVSCA